MNDQNPFPGITNILQLFKARITKPPATIPRARAGWIVWVAEVYPGLYLAQIPGAGSHYTDHCCMAWERVSDDIPTTTIEEIRAEDRRLAAALDTWRPGQAITTPGTRLSWCNLAEWNTAWRQLQRRRHSSRRYAQESAHKFALPAETISHETEPAVLYAFLDIMHSSNVRPPKGMRQGHPTTEHVVAANNRLSQLGAASYRRHRQQAVLRRGLRQLEPPRGRQPPHEEAAGHLSLF
ncbi:MAG: hypothetical protein KDE09_21845 [Anaerolineales bacterium]|nr:hypothetical protein [Anaerolineales bacterium]